MTGLLKDQLELIREAPAMAHLWHRLYLHALQLPAVQRDAVERLVRVQTMPDDWSAFLAATFLHGLTDSSADLGEAARIFCRSTLAVDAGQALLNLTFAHALRSAGSSADFARVQLEMGLAKVCAHLGGRLRAREPLPQHARRAGSGLKRVAVVAPSLSASGHAPTDMALHHARVLARRGLQVAVFSPQEFRMSDMATWLGVPRLMNLAPIPTGGWASLKCKMPVTVVHEALSMMARWRSILSQVRQFAPDVVLFVGAFSPLLQALHDEYPVAGLGINALAPAGPLDLWLAPDPGARTPWGFALGETRTHTRRVTIEVSQDAQPREELGLPQDAVVWVTSGTRLHGEMPNAWRDAILQLLDAHPSCVWLVVGRDVEKAPLPKDHPRIRLRPFDARFSALLAACDIYLNPPRVGGGYSVAHAMARAVPVLTLGGGDGGDKLGRLSQPDLAHYTRALAALSGDATARQRFGKILQHRFQRKLSLADSADALVQALETAIERSVQRRA